MQDPKDWCRIPKIDTGSQRLMQDAKDWCRIPKTDSGSQWLIQDLKDRFRIQKVQDNKDHCCRAYLQMGKFWDPPNVTFPISSLAPGNSLFRKFFGCGVYILSRYECTWSSCESEVYCTSTIIIRQDHRAVAIWNASAEAIWFNTQDSPGTKLLTSRKRPCPRGTSIHK